MLKYYLENQVFPSEYFRDCIVSSLCHPEEIIIPESDIPVLELDNGSDTEEQLFQEEFQISHQDIKQKQLNTTRSGSVFQNKPKYREPTILELERRFGKQSKKQRRCTRDRLWAEYKDTWEIDIEGDYAQDLILPIVSEHQIYQSNYGKGYCEDMSQFRLHYRQAKYYRQVIN